MAFSLARDYELPRKRKDRLRELKHGVQEMLVKHHLFSWDLN